MHKILFYLFIFQSGLLYAARPDSLAALPTELYSVDRVVPSDSFLRHHSGINFLMWSVEEAYAHCTYLFERSANGTDWTVLDVRVARRAPQGRSLAYYFKDTVGADAPLYSYRLMRMVSLEPDLHTEPQVDRDPAMVFKELDDEQYHIMLRREHEEITLYLLHESGAVMDQLLYSRQTEIHFDGSSYQNGSYLLLVEGDGKRYPVQKVTFDK